MYLIISILALLIAFFISIIKPEYRRILIIVNIFICIVYTLWRFTVIPVHHGIMSFILGISLYCAEILGLISFINFQYLFSKNHKLENKSLNNYTMENIPSVDVLICTYNEPLDLLQKTIIASKKLEYPQNKLKIYICDDGHRDELKHLCKNYNVNYITRDNNEGAKAGNINNALSIITGDLFAVLDADMIPKKNFLTKTVGYFTNENMAFVQTPQVYYNQDMYQYNLNKKIPNEQDFFMRDIEVARAASNAVLHVGTNAVFRKKYVLEIGGYPTCSITEDMAVGMLLQAKGYDSEFINEELVLGLSATTFTELVKQRDRWCRGNLQVMKKFNVLFNKGLTFGQKIAYLDGVIYWLSSIQKIIYILSPLIFLLSCKLIIDSSLKDLLIVFIPFLLGQVLVFNILSPRTRSLRWSHYYEVAMAPHITISIFRELLCLKSEFSVTSKDLTNNKKQFHFKMALPHILIAITSIFAWFFGTVSLLTNKINLGAYLINIIWSIYNFLGSIICIKVAYQNPIYRQSERISIKENIHIFINTSKGKLEGSLIDISEKGVAIKLNSPLDVKLNTKLDIHIDNYIIPCKVARNTDKLLGLKFDSLTNNQLYFIMNIYIDNMQAYYDPKKSPKYIKENCTKKGIFTFSKSKIQST
ncbi:glycosyltransferase [uncultured Clostridium sp.]|uniref:glycosyltransferase n=1 Tax=uncultured Clostridium sp. TaxID=59620 RepID=UPI0025E73C91|nr:glycosyltransferase [uncultured Clostridium sp.]